MLTFFNAPANAPQLTDKREIDDLYRYWRRHILLTIWLGYALFYFTRKSFNAAVPDILVSGVLTRSDRSAGDAVLHHLWRVEIRFRHRQ